MIHQSVGNSKQKKKAPKDEDNRVCNVNEMKMKDINVFLKEQNQEETAQSESLEEQGTKLKEKEREKEETLEKMARA